MEDVTLEIMIGNWPYEEEKYIKFTILIDYNIFFYEREFQRIVKIVNEKYCSSKKGEDTTDKIIKYLKEEVLTEKVIMKFQKILEDIVKEKIEEAYRWEG